MDQNRRRELRQARRERRLAEQHGTETAGAGGAAGGGRRRLFRSGAPTSGDGGGEQGAERVGNERTGRGGMSMENSFAASAAGTAGGGAADPTALMAMMTSNANTMNGGGGGGAPTAAGRRRAAASRRNDASRLAEKMNQKKRKMASRQQQLTAREARVQDTYAPNMRDILQGLTGADDAEDSAAVAAATTPAMMTNHVTGFDKDDLLAARIADTQANFLKIDQGLSEDHTLATQKLHTAVFAHANDFLLLFRDVDRASRLVEALKSNVQGTKSAISTMSKFTFAEIGNNSSSSGANRKGSAASSSPARTSASVFMGPAGMPTGAASVHGRVSLVAERERALTHNTNERAGMDALLSNRLAHAHHEQQPTASSTVGTTTAAAAGAGSGGGTTSGHRVMSGTSRATTRGLAVASLQQWRFIMGAPTTLTAPPRLRNAMERTSAWTDKPGSGVNSFNNRGGSALNDSTKDAESRSREIDMFVALLREQMTQLLSERRHADAAETVREIADEATRRGCLPLLLDLETDLVRSVLQNLTHIPQSPLLHESAQVPLIQLLLQFGRVKAGVSVFLALQTPWIQSELLTLQSRVANPTRVCWIAADYLVRLVHELLRRQQTLLLPTEEAHKISLTLDAAAEADLALATPTNPTGTAALARSKLETLTESLQKDNKLIPPTSTALLWVRQNMELFATRVLAAQVLSYGTGTDGGDPSRVRRAARMTSETIRVLQNISAQGSGATAASLTLQLLTPSIVLLESEFSRLTTTRVDNSGRAMVEQLITNSLLMYETAASTYQPTKCDDAVRKSNARCQRLESSLKTTLPASGHAWLVQVFLSPATTALFMATTNTATTSTEPHGTSSSSGETKNSNHARQAIMTPSSSQMPKMLPTKDGTMPSPLFPQERYRFVRYANGCSAVHQILLESVVGFICALGGTDGVLSGVNGSDDAASPCSPNFSPSQATGSAEKGATSMGSNAASTTLRRKPTTATTPAVASERGRGSAGKDNAGSSALGASPSSSAEASCAALLLSNALIFESVDVTLYRLFVSFLWTSLRERQTLVNYLTADTFRQAQRKLFPRVRVGGAASAAPPSSSSLPKSWPLLCDPVESPAFVLDGMLGLATDVLSTGAWISYVVRGDAVGHLLGSPQLTFRTQHLAVLHTAMPGIVQGWLACALALGHSTDAAVDMLPVPCSATVEEAAELVNTRRTQTRSGEKSTAGSGGGASREAAGVGGGGVASPTPSSPAIGGTLMTRTFEPPSLSVAGVASGTGHGTNHQGGAGGGGGGLVRRGGAMRVLVMQRRPAPISASAGSNTDPSPLAQKTLPGIRGVHQRRVRLLPESAVRQSKLRPFLMSAVDRAYETPAQYRVHLALPALPSLFQRRQDVAAQSKTTPSSGLAGAGLTAWNVRGTIPSYPEFPIGGDFDRKDELFLLHWCVQINLHLLSLFQERLLPASHLVNATAAAAAKEAQSTPASSLLKRQLAELKGTAPLQRPPSAPLPLPGGVSPQEDSALAALCGGGGNYPAAIATLQFLVLRVLRDVLCQVETWTVVYDCTSPIEWRQEESILRQQLFFFALFTRFWSPLFAGGMRVPLPHQRAAGTATTTVRRNERGGTTGLTGATTGGGADPIADDHWPSQWSLDCLPALAVLEWLTCGHAAFDMHLAHLQRNQRVHDAQARQMSEVSPSTAAPPTQRRELTEAQIETARRANPRLQTAVDTYFDPQRTTSSDGATAAVSGQGWKRADDALRAGNPAELPLSVHEATSLLAGQTGPFIPDTLLRVLQYFFEVQLGETRAVPAMTSDAMRMRVDKAMSSLDLMDFVGSNLADDEEEEDLSSSSGGSSSSATSSRGSTQSSRKAHRSDATPVTLANLRELVEFYVKPLL